MADEEYYLQVELEIKEGTKDIALWSKAKIIAEDNNTEAQLEYTKMRVTQLKTTDAKDKVAKVTRWFWPYIRPLFKIFLFFCAFGLVLNILAFIFGWANYSR